MTVLAPSQSAEYLAIDYVTNFTWCGDKQRAEYLAIDYVTNYVEERAYNMC